MYRFVLATGGTKSKREMDVDKAVIPRGTTKYLQPLDISVKLCSELIGRLGWLAVTNHSPRLSHVKVNFCSSLPLDSDSMEQCEKVHHHQQVSKSWTTAGRRGQIFLSCLMTKVTWRATLKERLTKSFWGCFIQHKRKMKATNDFYGRLKWALFSNQTLRIMLMCHFIF